MRALETGLWIYREYFLRRWRRSLLAKARVLPRSLRLRRSAPLRDADRDDRVLRQALHGLRRTSTRTLSGYAVTGNVLSNLRCADAADRRSRRSRDSGRGSGRSSPRRARSRSTCSPRGGHCAFLESYGLEQLARPRGARRGRRLAASPSSRIFDDAAALTSARFSWNVTGCPPLVTLISPSITAPSATAIEFPDKAAGDARGARDLHPLACRPRRPRRCRRRPRRSPSTCPSSGRPRRA